MLRLRKKKSRNRFARFGCCVKVRQLDGSSPILSDIAVYLSEKFQISHQVDSIADYISEQQVTYSPEIDEVCLIVDRDKGNFSRTQYEQVSEKCLQKGYRLFVSNPTFEFWLLLHTDRIFSYNATELLNNKRCGSKRYLEIILATEYDGYKMKKCALSDLFIVFPLLLETKKVFVKI